MRDEQADEQYEARPDEAGADESAPADRAPEGGRANEGEVFPEIPEVYYLESIEQLRAIADPLRARIFEALARRPLTVKRVATLLGEAPAKIHYHVRELERVGLLKLVATRERGGILEKDYRAVARVLVTTASLLQSQPDEVISAARDSIQIVAQGFLRALTSVTRPDATPNEIKGARLFIESAPLWVTPDEYEHLMYQVMQLLEAYNTPRGIPGEREALLSLIGYDTRLAQEPEGANDMNYGVAGDRTSSPAPDIQPSTVHGVQASGQNVGVRTRRVSIVGALSYSRADLELIVAQGQRLDLNVLGYLGFANDVTPDLIDRSIERLRYKGVLRASDAVTVALNHKSV
jgi:DNA-binding transcriptional ArsR family regulator